MKALGKVGTACVLAAPLALTAPSTAGVVTFDELGAHPSDFFLVNPLRDEYAGLRFSGPSALDGGAILDQNSNFGISARSGRNFLAFNRLPAATMANGGRPLDPETIEFLSSPVSSVEIYCFGTNSLNFVMEGFDSNGKLVTRSEIANNNTAWVRLAISSTTPISKVSLSETKGGSPAWIFDDLSFTPIPAPAGLAALGLGSVFLVRRRR